MKARREDRCPTRGGLAARVGIRRRQTIAGWGRDVVRPRLRQPRPLCAARGVAIAERRAALADAARRARHRDPHHA